jgi:tRNA (guanine-N7-)-methyltransferase
MILEPASWTRELAVEQLFETPAPLEVDVGCGKGRFLLARAQAFPNVNFIGIDRQRGRLEKIRKRAERAGIPNIRLVQIEASYAIRYLLPVGSVDTFYIFFPDPWPKRRHHRRRLFASDFPDHLNRTLKAGGLLHVATDHLEYFDEIYTMLEADTRFSPAPTFAPELHEQTDFERIFLGQAKPIGRCSFRKADLPQSP